MFEERVGFYPSGMFPPDGLIHLQLRVKLGDRVAVGDIVAMAELDMAEQEWQAYRGGRIVGIRKLERGYILEMEEL